MRGAWTRRVPPRVTPSARVPQARVRAASGRTFASSARLARVSSVRRAGPRARDRGAPPARSRFAGARGTRVRCQDRTRPRAASPEANGLARDGTSSAGAGPAARRPRRVRGRDGSLATSNERSRLRRRRGGRGRDARRGGSTRQGSAPAAVRPTDLSTRVADAGRPRWSGRVSLTSGRTSRRSRGSPPGGSSPCGLPGGRRACSPTRRRERASAGPHPSGNRLDARVPERRRVAVARSRCRGPRSSAVGRKARPVRRVPRERSFDRVVVVVARPTLTRSTREGRERRRWLGRGGAAVVSRSHAGSRMGDCDPGEALLGSVRRCEQVRLTRAASRRPRRACRPAADAHQRGPSSATADTPSPALQRRSQPRARS